MTGDEVKLRWRCRRGMRELDIVLTAFLDAQYPHLSSDDKARFESLLELPDPDLYAYLLGRDEPTDPDLSGLVRWIRAGSDS